MSLLLEKQSQSKLEHKTDSVQSDDEDFDPKEVATIDDEIDDFGIEGPDTEEQNIGR